MVLLIKVPVAEFRGFQVLILFLGYTSIWYAERNGRREIGNRRRFTLYRVVQVQSNSLLTNPFCGSTVPLPVQDFVLHCRRLDQDLCVSFNVVQVHELRIAGYVTVHSTWVCGRVTTSLMFLSLICLMYHKLLIIPKILQLLYLYNMILVNHSSTISYRYYHRLTVTQTKYH